MSEAVWGAHGVYRNRGAAVLRLLRENFSTKPTYCLGRTKLDNMPKHPLYLAADTPRIELAR